MGKHQEPSIWTARLTRGALCGKTARRDLRGGRQVTDVPTLICKKMNRMTREMIKSMPPPRKHRTDYDYPPSPEDRSKVAEGLCERIRAAFTGVKLADGIGLWQAQGLDDYEPPEVCAEYRLKDEAEDWSRISDDTLQHCNSSPSFLDAKGFRFYMPAFMLSELRGDYGFDFRWSLIHFDTLEYARYELLDAAQRAVVRDYLIFFTSDPNDTYSRDDIMYALETYWTEASCKVPTEPVSTEAEQASGGNGGQTR
jgi:hypothetical protein